MTNKSDEIIRELQRIANDSNLHPKVRNKALEAAQYIRVLHNENRQLRGVDIVLETVPDIVL